MSSNVSINFNNYNKTEEQFKRLHQKLEPLMRQIPCDSRVTLDFEYKKKVFYGKLKVELSKKVLFSKDESVLLENLTHSLCKKACKQVMKWKKSRTFEEITGIIEINKLEASASPGYQKVS